MFALDYFGRPGYLAQSPQFYKQIMVGVFERVFEVGPVFRAEPHDTARHLAQYTSLDAEMGFVADHRDVMAVLRDTLAGMLGDGRRGPARWHARRDAPQVPAEIPAVHFTEALRIAGAPADEPDLAPAHERALGEWALREHGSDFVFVDRLPDARSGRSTPIRTRPTRRTRTASTCSSGVWRSSPAGSGCTGYDDYLAALAARGEPLEPYAGLSRRVPATACRRTAASRSGWNGSWPGCSARPTSGR